MMTSSHDIDAPTAAAAEPAAGPSDSDDGDRAAEAPTPRPRAPGSLSPEAGDFQESTPSIPDIRVRELEDRIAAQQRELAELRAAEGTARALSRALPDYVQILDPEGRVFYQTPAVERALGFRDRDIIGHSWLEAIAPDDRARLRDIQQAMVARASQARSDATSGSGAAGPGSMGDPDEVELDAELLTHDGRRRLFALRLSNQYANPRVRGLIVSGHDITAHASALRDAERERDTLRADAAARSGLLGVLGHEVRTPLNGILGTVRLLRETVLDPVQHEHVRTILRSGESLLALLNGLVDLARSDSGKLNIAAAPFSPGAVLTEVLGLARPQAAHAGIELRVSIDPALPPTLLGDAVRFRQVVSNLLHNALKFTRQGSVMVTARAEDGGHLFVEVKDSGIGMTPAETEGVFKPFAQANDTIANRYGGSGLGLAICKAITEAWDGDIGVESEPGRGSRFWFRMPMRIAPAASLESASETTSDDGAGIADAPPTVPPLRVLLADDNPVNQRIARSMLENFGLRVSTATNGKTALDAVSRGGFDLVLMDVHMPDMDGVEATKAIRQLEDTVRAATPVIALTADTDTDDLDRYKAAGAQDTVAKPIDPDVLLRTIADVMADREPLPDLPRPNGALGTVPIAAHGGTSEPTLGDDASGPGVVVPMVAQGPAASDGKGVRKEDQPGASGPKALDAWAGLAIDTESIDERALDRLAQSVGQDQVSKLIDDFRRHSHHTIVQLRKALERHDLQAANRAAHELKGMAGSFGLHRLYESAVEVGRHCKDDDEPAVTTATSLLVSVAEEAVANLELYRARKGA